MTKLSGVGGILSVGHLDHGHSYEVVAWYRFGSDARVLKRHLDTALSDFDHTILPDSLSLGESLAEHIAAQLPGCIAVDVNRPLERIYARWEA